MGRHLLQLHHVHGRLQRRHHHPGPQLPPQTAGHPRDAGMGERYNSCMSKMQPSVCLGPKLTDLQIQLASP